MINKVTKKQCRRCLYNKEGVKFIVSPCIRCKVNGGDNDSIIVRSLFTDNISGKKINRR